MGVDIGIAMLIRIELPVEFGVETLLGIPAW